MNQGEASKKLCQGIESYIETTDRKHNWKTQGRETGKEIEF